MSDLWSSIAQSQEPVVTDASALESLRHAVVAKRDKRGIHQAWWALAAVPAMAAALWFGLPRSATQSFHVGSHAGSVGVMLVAEVAELPVHFVDGSAVVLAAGSRGKVLRLGTEGADVELTNGSLEAHVIHAPQTRWTFRAGTYEILVIGTKFRAAWNAERQELEVNMHEGSVQVVGGGLNQALILRSGDILAATPTTQTIRRVGALSAMPSTASPMVAPAEVIKTPSPNRRHAAAQVAGYDTWQTLATRGAHAEAFALAQGQSISRLCGTLPASDLLLLADTARYAQKSDAALRVFKALVQRFPHAAEAVDAAFALGRMAFAKEQWSQSARWFESVVAKAPSGTLAAAAWGRLMESQERARDVPAARRAAARYLELYPQGPQRSLATRLLREGSSDL